MSDVERHYWDALRITFDPEQPCIICGFPQGYDVHYQNHYHWDKVKDSLPYAALGKERDTL